MTSKLAAETLASKTGTAPKSAAKRKAPERSEVEAPPPKKQSVRRVRALGLLLDVKTRWNSILAMLMRAYELKFAYDMFVNKAGDAYFKFKMSSDDWDNLRVVIALLNPLYLATLKLSKSKFPSLSETLPTYMGLTKVTFKHSSLIMWHIVV